MVPAVLYTPLTFQNHLRRFEEVCPLSRGDSIKLITDRWINLMQGCVPGVADNNNCFHLSLINCNL